MSDGFISSLRLFEAGMNIHARYTPRNDPILKQLALETLALLPKSEVLRKVVNNAFKNRSISAPYCARLYEIGIQELLLHDPILCAKYPNYPHGFEEPALMHSVLEQILDPQYPKLSTRLTEDLKEPTVGSNDKQHAVGAQLLAHLLGMHKPITILDIGCSQNFCLKTLGLIGQKQPKDTLSLKRPIGFGPINMVDTNGAPNKTLTKFINNLCATPISMKVGLGLDKCDLADKKRQLHVRATPYPSLLKDPETLRQHDFLSSIQLPNVHFFKGDFMTLNSEELNDQLSMLGFEKGRAKLVVMANMLSQLSTEEERWLAIFRALNYLDKSEGYLLVQHYISPDGKRIDFVEDWYREQFQYRILVLDPRRIERGFMEFLVAQDGSCQTMRLGNDIQEILGTKHYNTLPLSH